MNTRHPVPTSGIENSSAPENGRNEKLEQPIDVFGTPWIARLVLSCGLGALPRLPVLWGSFSI